MSSLHFLGVFIIFFWLLQKPTHYFHLYHKMKTRVFDFLVGYCPTQVTLSGSIPSCSSIQPYDKEKTLASWLKSAPKTIQSTPRPFFAES
jgi:hypothetical protein